LRARAEALLDRLGVGDVVDHDATLGGGSLPGDRMPSIAVRLHLDRIEPFAKRLRLGDPPVVGRIADGALHLDLRTIDPADDETLAAALERALAIEAPR
jgi:L-seryl-tRNA(Ser) seleniumtransferase